MIGCMEVDIRNTQTGSRTRTNQVASSPRRAPRRSRPTAMPWANPITGHGPKNEKKGATAGSLPGRQVFCHEAASHSRQLGVPARLRDADLTLVGDATSGDVVEGPQRPEHARGRDEIPSTACQGIE